MPNVTITPEAGLNDADLYRARVNGHQAVGRTAGEALDGLSDQLASSRGTTVVLVQKLGADEFFDSTQIQRLNELVARWRAARDAGRTLAAADQQELDTLIETEFEASARRAAALADQLPQ
ncbi:MAG TPA: hypothetical protein VNT79_09400 [Phycisphaerae bacterium]|nr:hypothetical protein [Phycisphaerae bacterium]